jgi:hypothetical protein
MIYDYENKIIQLKIVYYGPAMSGKTTSLKYLFKFFNKIESVSSIENSLGRTLFFDFGVLNFYGKEWILKILIYSVTGQDFYSSTRPATLSGLDGLIFVVDSQFDKFSYNLDSWKELKNYFGSRLYEIPIIINLNKNDIKDKRKISPEKIKDSFKLNDFSFIKFKNTSAINGEGIISSFKSLLNYIFPELKIINYNTS